MGRKTLKYIKYPALAVVSSLHISAPLRIGNLAPFAILNYRCYLFAFVWPRLRSEAGFTPLSGSFPAGFLLAADHLNLKETTSTTMRCLSCTCLGQAEPPSFTANISAPQDVAHHRSPFSSLRRRLPGRSVPVVFV